MKYSNLLIIISLVFLVIAITILLLWITDSNCLEQIYYASTPIVALVTGFILFITFREYQKTNFHHVSEKNYEHLYNALCDHISQKFISKEFRDSNGMKIDEAGFFNDLELLIKSDPKNWFENLINTMYRMNEAGRFKKIIEDYKQDIINENNFLDARFATLYEFIDHFISHILTYYSYYQKQLYYLLVNKLYKDDFTELDRNKLIEFINRKTGYKECMNSIEIFFHFEKEKVVNLPVQNIPSYNTKILVREFENDRYVLKMRNLIRWELFSNLYYYHQDILKVSQKLEQKSRRKLKKYEILS